MRLLDAVATRLLAGLATGVPQLLGSETVGFVDIDDTIREVHGVPGAGRRLRLLGGQRA